MRSSTPGRRSKTPPDRVRLEGPTPVEAEFPLRIDPCATFPRPEPAGVNGVIDMGFLSVIRRWALRDHLPIREIARRTGLSRNTIRKYLRSGAMEPEFQVPDRPSKLDPFAAKLSAWLKTEAGKSRKQRRTLKQFFADLVVLGFAGSYGRVAAFARAWRADRQRGVPGPRLPAAKP
jgi:transcriptional regulator with XRE-family HTH domain